MPPIFKQFNADLENYIVLLSSGFSFLIFLSFAAYRFVVGDISLGIFDLIISIGSIVVFIQALRSRSFDNLAALQVSFYVGSLLAVLYMRGFSLIYWLYPTMAFIYFFLPAWTAVRVNIGVTLVTVPILLVHEPPIFELVSVYATCILVCLAGYVFSLRTENQKNKLLELATIDPLTLVENRRSLEDRLDEIVISNARIPTSRSIIVCDLDFFKKVNDNYGHVMGDKILVHFANIINTTIRASDRLYRFGGEEFVVIANNTSLENAGKLAESLRKLVEGDSLLKKYDVTASFGVTEMSESDTKESWFNRADTALYQAKEACRNVVFIAKLDDGIEYRYIPFYPKISCRDFNKSGSKSLISNESFEKGTVPVG